MSREEYRHIMYQLRLSGAKVENRSSTNAPVSNYAYNENMESLGAFDSLSETETYLDVSATTVGLHLDNYVLVKGKFYFFSRPLPGIPIKPKEELIPRPTREDITPRFQRGIRIYVFNPKREYIGEFISMNEALSGLYRLIVAEDHPLYNTSIGKKTLRDALNTGKLFRDLCYLFTERYPK